MLSFFQNPAISWCNGQVAEVISKFKSFHYWAWKLQHWYFHQLPSLQIVSIEFISIILCSISFGLWPILSHSMLLRYNKKSCLNENIKDYTATDKLLLFSMSTSLWKSSMFLVGFLLQCGQLSFLFPLTH